MLVVVAGADLVVVSVVGGGWVVVVVTGGADVEVVVGTGLVAAAASTDETDVQAGFLL